MWWENTFILRDSPDKIMLECVGGLDVKIEEKLKMLMEVKDTTSISYENATNGIGKIASALLTVFKMKENDIVAVGHSPNSSFYHSNIHISKQYTDRCT